MSDQCKHCIYRGDMKSCEDASCFHHELRYVEQLQARYDALVEAARPVAEWWAAYRRFMERKGQIPNPVLSVISKADICRVEEQQLDALAALVGEEWK